MAQLPYPSCLESFLTPEVLAALAGIGIVVAVIGIAVYIYAAFALMAIAKRTGTKNGWLAFIPIANIYLMTQIAKLPAWYTFAVLLAIIPIVGGLAATAAIIYIWWKIAEAIQKPGWWSLLMLIPVVNLVIMGVMAWGKK